MAGHNCILHTGLIGFDVETWQPDRATGVASDSLNGGNQRTAEREFALAA
jgi:hypothetical protein